MTQYFARVSSGIVAEIIAISDDLEIANCFTPQFVSDLVAASSSITAGQTYSDGTFGPSPQISAEAATPPSVTRRQFFQAAAQESIITEAEAEAVFDPGTIPAAVLTAISTIPADEQFAARMAIRGNATFERANPLLEAIGAAMGQAPAQIDALFVLAASL